MVTQFAVFAPVGILIIGLDIFGVVNEWVRLGIAGVSLIVYGWYKVRKHPLVVSIGARFGLA
jgi:hypothetical protein